MTASSEQKPVTKSNSRRALLAGAIGGIGAVAAGAIAKVSPVRAEGETMVVGGEYTTATSQTALTNMANASTVLRAENTGAGTGIYGGSSSGYGVWGSSDSLAAVYGTGVSGTGVYATSSTGYGIRGLSGAASLPAVLAQATGGSTGLLATSGTKPAARAKTGVFGYADQDAMSRGVIGRSPAGQGLRGETVTGVGVYGKANKNGLAVRAYGRIKADKVSGVTTIPAGSTVVTVSPGVNVTSGSFVLLTPKANIGSRGLWFTTNASADTFRIRMSSTRSANTKVAWLLLG